jgi:RNA-directed DNA polymerase
MTETVTSGLMRGRWRRSDGPLEGDTRPKWGETARPRTPCTPPRLRPTLLVILVHNDRRQDWLVEAVAQRLREELAKLDVRVNEEKSRIVDLTRGESFGFLGFDFRRVRSLRGRWRPQYTPKLKKRTALLQELKEVFRRHRSQPVEALIVEINPKLRGWVNYFRIGHARRCFAFVRLWVERRVRRHLMRARNRRGFGWKRWSTAWLHTTLGLFADYRVRYLSRA